MGISVHKQALTWSSYISLEVSVANFNECVVFMCALIFLPAYPAKAWYDLLPMPKVLMRVYIDLLISIRTLCASTAKIIALSQV